MQQNLLPLLYGTLLIIAVVYIIRYYLREQAAFLLNFSAISKPYKSVPDRSLSINSLLDESKTSIEHAQLAQQVEENIQLLSLPVPEAIVVTDSGNTIIEKLGRIFNSKSPVFTGTEQLVLMVLPPDQVANCLMFAANSLGEQTSASIKEILPILKQSAHEGAINLSHVDWQVVQQCLSEFFTSLKSVLSPGPPDITTITGALSHVFPNHQDILSGIGLATDTVDPIFHIHQHTSEIKDVVLTHAKHVVHSTHAHAVTTLHSSVGAHVPYITIFFSTVREINLLSDRKTDVETSLKNIALDTFGTGGGALAGGKAGAAIGAFFGPIGIGIGAVIGAIGGGIGGRALTNNIKESDLKAALTDYQYTYSSMLTSLRTKALEAYNTTQDVIDTTKEKYTAALRSVPGPSKHAQDGLGYIYALQDALKTDIQSSLVSITEQKKSIIFMFSPVRHQLIALEQELSHAFNRLQKAKTPLEVSTNLATLPYPIDGRFMTLMPATTQMLSQHNAQFMPLLMGYTYQTAQLYRGACATVVNTLNQEAIRYENEGKSWKVTLDGKENKVISERQKLGK